MAKNAVTDWSTNDALNTDIGSTNIAEACAPSGINDAIRKVMAQMATYITAPTFSGALTGTTGAFSGALSGSTVQSSLAMRAMGASTFGAAGAGVEIQYSGTAGTIAAYDRGAAADKDLSFQGANLYHNSATHNFRNLAGSATFATINSSGLAVTGTGTFTSTATASAFTASVSGAGRAVIDNGGVGSYGKVSFQQNTGSEDAKIGGNAYSSALLFNCTNGFSFTGGGTMAVTGAVTVSSTLAVTGAATFASTATVKSAGIGGARVNAGDASNSGYFEFLNTSGASMGYIQQAIGGVINYINSGGFGHTFTGGGVTAASLALTGALTSATITTTGSVSVGGTLTAISPGGGTTGGLRVRGDSGGGPAIIQFLNNAGTVEWGNIVCTATKMTFIVGGVVVASIDSSGNLRVLTSVTSPAAP